MTACEACWAEASAMAAYMGGSAADYYRDALARNEGQLGHVDNDTPAAPGPAPDSDVFGRHSA